MLKSSPLHLVSFKLKSSLTDSISQSYLFLLATHSVSPSLKNLPHSDHSTNPMKHQELRNPKDTKRETSRNTPKDPKRNIKPRHRRLGSIATASWSLHCHCMGLIPLFFYFGLHGLGFLFLMDFCLGFCLHWFGFLHGFLLEFRCE